MKLFSSRRGLETLIRAVRRISKNRSGEAWLTTETTCLFSMRFSLVFDNHVLQPPDAEFCFFLNVFAIFVTLLF